MGDIRVDKDGNIISLSDVKIIYPQGTELTDSNLNLIFKLNLNNLNLSNVIITNNGNYGN